VAVIPAVDHVLPTGLTLPSILIASGQPAAVDGGALATAVLGTVVLVAACVVGAIAAFARREL
jgi:hypothetical protein